MIPNTMIKIVSSVLILAFFLVIAGCISTSSQPDLAKAELKSVPVRDITIAYKEVGSGEPLILIMGYSETMDI